MDSPEIAVTAPQVPVEFRYNQSVTHFQRTPGGGMELVFTPALNGPRGAMLVLPQVRIAFGSREQWENFQRQVANDGKISEIVVAKPSLGSI